MVNKIPLWVRVLPVYFLIFGIIYMPVAAQREKINQLKIETAKSEQNLTYTVKTYEVISSGKPVAVTIASVGIDINIVDGLYNSSTGWSVDNKFANYATITPVPNNTSGNTVIYGHDLPHVFRRTADLKIGDNLHIKTEQGTVFIYSYTGDSVVAPTNVAIFQKADEGAPRLTLITCSGRWSEARRIMNFEYKGYTK